MQLLELETNEKALIRRLEGGRAVISRLASLGFTPGAAVTMIRRNDKGPILVSLRGSRIALGHGEAKHILISLAREKENRKNKAIKRKSILIAVAGQPNVGKSTVFNALTGLNQHVGNWAGKTIELKSGLLNFKEKEFSLVDLPGTYSLSAGSEEERISRDFIIKEHPDLIIAIVNAAELEHNLYLIAELLLLPVPIILALNMMDVAEQEEIQVEPKVLEATLGIPVVPLIASRNTGISELKETIYRLSNHETPYNPKKPLILPAHRIVLDQMKALISPFVPSAYPDEWVALKLLEGDEELTKIMKSAIPPTDWEHVHSLLYKHEDAILDIAGARYEWIARVVRAAIIEPKTTRVGLTSRLDRLLTQPVLGTFILIGILGIAFWLTYTVGNPIQGWLTHLINQFAQIIRAEWSTAPRWIVEFFAGGILGGIGMVLTFLPILIIFFLILGFMEDTGYMARAAYLTDRWMHMMGLHGKSFMPMLLGFGCNVPAVLGTRIIESPRARLLTILLIPLIPCAARMAVITILASLFFGHSALWVAWGLIGGDLLLIAGLGVTLHHFLFKNEHVSFIMELPLYHMPNFRTIGIYIWQNVLGFLQKAGTIILIATMIVWGLSYFPSGSVMTSYLANIGQFLEPIGRLMGLPWPVLIALITSLIAKENTIATLGILYNGLNNVVSILTPSAALGFLVFQILFIPCVGTIAAIRQETHSWKWTALSIGIQLIISLGLSILVFQIGKNL